jgi:hypothetical protein
MSNGSRGIYSRMQQDRDEEGTRWLKLTRLFDMSVQCANARRCGDEDESCEGREEGERGERRGVLCHVFYKLNSVVGLVCFSTSSSWPLPNPNHHIGANNPFNSHNSPRPPPTTHDDTSRIRTPSSFVCIQNINIFPRVLAAYGAKRLNRSCMHSVLFQELRATAKIRGGRFPQQTRSN